MGVDRVLQGRCMLNGGAGDVTDGVGQCRASEIGQQGWSGRRTERTSTYMKCVVKIHKMCCQIKHRNRKCNTTINSTTVTCRYSMFDDHSRYRKRSQQFSPPVPIVQLGGLKHIKVKCLACRHHTLSLGINKKAQHSENLPTSEFYSASRFESSIQSFVALQMKKVLLICICLLSISVYLLKVASKEFISWKR